MTLALPMLLTFSAAAVTKLSPATEEILSLSRAGISEVVILTYIDSSARIYDLRPDQIIYLRDQSVSDAILNAMLDQRKKVAATTPVQGTLPPTPSAPVEPIDPTFTSCPLACPLCGGPLFVDMQPIPMSTLHIIPYPSNRQFYYSSGYRFWPPPSLTFGPYHVFDTTISAWNYQRWMEPFPCGHWHYCPRHCGW
jgi:hypothetical protein